ncbi:DUF6338 family protein [Streptomyces bobili]|uniref:DUF6338 family protein n=1 Tax=Streptomyces bobili TaxID=67280 RepID=UPI003F540036
MGPCFIRARLKSGSWVGGWYGAGSYASSHPVPTRPVPAVGVAACPRRPVPVEGRPDSRAPRPPRRRRSLEFITSEQR